MKIEFRKEADKTFLFCNNEYTGCSWLTENAQKLDKNFFEMISFHIRPNLLKELSDVI